MSQAKYWARDEILIVDDDDLQRELMRNSLEDLGLEIHEAADGAEALEVFRERSPMLVVMDIHMPVMDGFQACQEMKRLCGGDGAAVILVTGMKDLASIQKAYDMGAMEFITKPLDWRMLLMRVKYIMRIQKRYLGVERNLEGLSWAQRAAGVGSWKLDPATQKVCVSDEVVRILGMHESKQCVSFSDLGAAIHKADQKTIFRSYQRLLEDDIPMDLDVTLDLNSRKSVIVHIYGEAILDGSGHRISINGTIQDITERKLAEEKISEASAMKDQFLTNISHELRTPVNGMMGMADLLQRTKMDEEQAMLTSNLVESSRHLLSVLNDVLDFAAMESGSVRIQSSHFKLSEIVESSGKLVEAMAKAKNLEMSTILEKDLPDDVVGDAGRIKQVLLNLAGNAIKFTEQGSIRIKVSLEGKDAQKCQVRFAVKDTGIGIPFEKQKTVFEQFVQVDGSLCRKFGGTGLGLAISKELVELMGGTISLQSRKGEGTEVCFVLPLEAVGALNDEVTRKTSPANKEPNLRTGGNVLLVEDNPINQIFTKKVLEHFGFDVDVVNNGQEALVQVQKASYGIVLMDCQMPVMDGYEATRNIRRLGKDYEKLPIIALTAHAMDGDHNKCMEAGMDDYMTKPFVGTELVQFLEKWINLNHPVGV